MYAPRTSGHRLWLKLTATVVGFATLAAAWFFLAPPAIGGQTSWVVTDGISMRPKIHAGDLALVRPQSSYRVGDIVAYHSRTLHVVVLHRIIAVTHAGYFFRGDNNAWPDPGPVTRAQTVGKLWVLAPGVGGELNTLRSPVTMAILAGLAVVLLTGGAGVQHVRRGRRRRPQPKWAPRTSTSTRSWVGGSYGGALAVAVVALAACICVAALAWTAPTRRTVPATVSYRQSGRFAYSASTATGAVYDTGRATTGQPIFSRLAGPVQVQFAYALESHAAAAVGGTASLAAVVSSPSGWTRTIPLQAPTRFTGGHVTVSGTVHLRKLQRLLQRVATATQVADESFSLALVPDIHAHGLIAGHAFSAHDAPQLPFTLTTLELSPVLPAAAPGKAAPPAASAGLFHPASTSTLSSTASEPVDLGRAGLRVRVADARRIGVAGVAAALIAVIVALRLLLRSREADEPTRIRARYGESIVTVVHSSLGRHTDLVQVKSIEELARIAERYTSMIIHEQTVLGHAYLVADGSTLYAYLLSNEGSDRPLRERLTSVYTPPSGSGSTPSRGVTRTIPA